MQFFMEGKSGLHPTFPKKTKVCETECPKLCSTELKWKAMIFVYSHGILPVLLYIDSNAYHEL